MSVDVCCVKDTHINRQQYRRDLLIYFPSFDTFEIPYRYFSIKFIFFRL